MVHAPHEGTLPDGFVDVAVAVLAVRRPQVAHEVVAAVVDVARLRLGAPALPAAVRHAPRVRHALVALELLARRERRGAEVAWQLLLLANLVVIPERENVVLITALFCSFVFFFFSWFSLLPPLSVLRMWGSPSMEGEV